MSAYPDDALLVLNYTTVGTHLHSKTREQGIDHFDVRK